jgi:hypothetical protein
MPDEKNNEVYVRGPGGLLQRLKQRYSTPQDPELPEKMKPDNAFNPWRPEFLSTGAMDPFHVGRLKWEVSGKNANPRTRKTVADDGNPITYTTAGNKTYAHKDTTLGSVANVLFNEYRALQGNNPKDRKNHYAGDEQLKKAKSDTAYAILNTARYRPGTQVAPSVLNDAARQPPEYKRDFQDYRNTVWNAFAGYVMGKDPVEGRGNYNFRVRESNMPRQVAGRTDPEQTVYKHYGPFYDPNQRKEKNPAQDSWLTIYNPPVNPAYAQPKPPKGQK